MAATGGVRWHGSAAEGEAADAEFVGAGQQVGGVGVDAVGAWPWVERPMPYVRDSFWRGREFASLPQMQAEAGLAGCQVDEAMAVQGGERLPEPGAGDAGQHRARHTPQNMSTVTLLSRGVAHVIDQALVLFLFYWAASFAVVLTRWPGFLLGR
jgi:hypothetical protein